MRFSEDKISDQKRLARGEHLLASRTWLRARDHAHNGKWRVMVLAGENPSGEVTAIREVMPHSHITAVDRQMRCLEAAISAGVDEIVQADLADFTWEGNWKAALPVHDIRQMPLFDLINLDLCAGASPATQKLIKVYSRHVATRGLMCVTFSYGRDVREAFVVAAERQSARTAWLTGLGIPTQIVQRLVYLLDGAATDSIRSVIAYRGNEMPMCSVLLSVRVPSPTVSFLQLQPGDFELAVVYPDSARLYDCPAERIASLRRSFAAQKAVSTKRGKALTV